MSLTQRFLSLIDTWRPAFCKGQAFFRIREHAVASVSAFGRKTISNLLIFLGRDRCDHTADYRVYSEYKWEPNDLFDPLLEECIKLIKNDTLCLAVDDSRLKKTGKKIPGTGWQKDPLGPPFQVNLIWALRFLQFSAILPLYEDHDLPPRAIPVRFIDAPNIKKPGKRASEEDIAAYKAESQKHNLSTLFVRAVQELRCWLDAKGYAHIKLLITVDGSFCNRTCMSLQLPNTELVARARKNTRLCLRRRQGSGNRFYDPHTFTPEAIRGDGDIKWATADLYYGGKRRAIRYKEVREVLWQGGTKRRPLRLIVLAAIPYVRGGIRHYRQPAYLLTTDLTTPAAKLIQAYLDRWQIEVNFREEKSILGVGEAQVRHERSVSRQPAFQVSVYAALLLASVLEYQDQYHADFGEQPKWRRPGKRPSCRALVGQMRRELIEDSTLMLTLDLSTASIASILRKAA
jgi:hypothetical protein